MSLGGSKSFAIKKNPGGGTTLARGGQLYTGWLLRPQLVCWGRDNKLCTLYITCHVSQSSRQQAATSTRNAHSKLSQILSVCRRGRGEVGSTPSAGQAFWHANLRGIQRAPIQPRASAAQRQLHPARVVQQSFVRRRLPRRALVSPRSIDRWPRYGAFVIEPGTLQPHPA